LLSFSSNNSFSIIVIKTWVIIGFLHLMDTHDQAKIRSFITILILRKLHATQISIASNGIGS
jgi:hypothetical protein